MSEVKDIITRLEKSTGADRGLDRDIAERCGWERKVAGIDEDDYWKFGDYSWTRETYDHPPQFTASIDAALTLVPAVCWARVQTATRDFLPLAWCHDEQTEDEADAVEGATAAIALCIAALKARKATSGRT